MKSKGQPELSVPKGFLMQDEDYHGISYGVSILTDYDHAANYKPPMDDFRYSVGSYSVFMSQVVPGGSYGFGDGLVGTPSVFFQNDQNCGLYRIGNDDWGAAVAGALVTEWVAGGFRVNNLTSGSVVFAGASGLLSQNNASFFWDDANTFLKILGTAGKQLRLAFDGTDTCDFTVDTSGFLTLSPSGDVVVVDDALRVGTATDALDAGDFSAGLTGAARMVFDQSDCNIYLYGTESPQTPGYYIGNSTTAHWLMYEILGVAGAQGTLNIRDVAAAEQRITIAETTGIVTVLQILNVGSAADSATRGDFATGITGASRLFFDQSAQTLSVYDSSGNEDISLDAAGNSWYNGTGNFGFGTTGPDRKVDILSASAAQLRLTHTDGSVYGEFQADGSGNVLCTFTGSIFQASVTSPAGKTVTWRALNSDNTTATSHAYFVARVGGGSGGDPAIQFTDNSTFWTMGYDNSASDNFRLCNGAALGTAGLAIDIDTNENVAIGPSGALATTATNGFLYVPTCAGTPTGTPTAITGKAPVVVDTTNNKLYFYSGGAWRDAGP